MDNSMKAISKLFNSMGCTVVKSKVFNDLAEATEETFLQVFEHGELIAEVYEGGVLYVR